MHVLQDSLCSWISEPESVVNNWRGWRKQSSFIGRNFFSRHQDKDGNVVLQSAGVPFRLDPVLEEAGCLPHAQGAVHPVLYVRAIADQDRVVGHEGVLEVHFGQVVALQRAHRECADRDAARRLLRIWRIELKANFVPR